jgi:AraC-like DNA-binding protein
MDVMRDAANFFRYLGPAPQAEWWGLAVTAGGSYRAPPGKPYPPPGHPSDHQFTWEQGRVLGTYQLLYLVAGRGRFDSRATGPIELTAGQVLVLCPHTWHRYQPAPGVGWHEHWIEIRGAIPSKLQKEGVLKAEAPVLTPTDAATVGVLLDRILESLRNEDLRSSPLTGAWALELLAQLYAPSPDGPSPTPIALAIGRAERLLEANLARPPLLEPFAQKLGIGYSYFRREFKKTTGLSPGQYVRRLRLEKARRLLGTSPLPVKAIAEELGFSSEFHFSAAFKKQFGVAPAHWRNSTRPH